MPNHRTLLSTVTHGRVLRRRLPADLGGGYFPASTEGGLKYLRRDVAAIDPVLTGFARTFVKQGAQVWDIGANVGLFTFAAAGLAGTVGRVVAVEADIWLAANLRRAATWNHGRSAAVDVLPVAVADGAGIAEFNIARNSRATNFLSTAGASTQSGGVRERQHVPTLALDHLLEAFPPPDVLKIDVEGAERLVLTGGRKVLEHRPTLLIEVNGRHQAVVDDLLRPLGYTYQDADTGAGAELPPWNTVALAG